MSGAVKRTTKIIVGPHWTSTIPSMLVRNRAWPQGCRQVADPTMIHLVGGQCDHQHCVVPGSAVGCTH